jgi:non-specific serine/threonine protein kinase
VGETPVAAGLDRASLVPGRPALPVPLTRLVGRERELARVTALLAGARLLTLTGSGGVGKTRVALEVARALAASYPDGAAWADLAPLTDPALVPQALVAALGLQEARGQPLLATLLAGLRERRLLVVVDNAEHLVDAVARLVEAVLRGCPAVTVLATSREPLGVESETVWRVPSLPVPAADQASPDELAQVAAVALFTERTQAALPDFALSAENAAAVAEVCRRLDGIPLAIELAAARAPALGVAGLAAHLDDRFRLLTGGRRTSLRRQQTLQATIDWSHDLLTEPERILFRRLAVFAGGWAPEAAEAVCAGEGIEGGEALDLLARLVDKSLVVAEERAGAVRYRLLETVRQYAGDKLLQAGEAAAARDRHRDWFLALAERAEFRRFRPDNVEWLARLEAENDNLRAALAWSLAGPADGEAGPRLVLALGMFWVARDYVSEGLSWLERALAQRVVWAPTLRVELLRLAVELANRLLKFDRAAAWAAEGLALARAAGNRSMAAWALVDLGIVAIYRGDYPAAQVHLAEAATLAQAVGDHRLMDHVLFQQGRLLYFAGEYTAACRALEEALAGARRAGPGRLFYVAYILNWLSLALARQGEYERARALQEESLALKRQVGERQAIGNSLQSLGLIARLEGNVAEAHDRFIAALRLQWEAGERLALPWTLEGLAWVAAARGQAERAARLLGAAATVRAASGLTAPVADRAQSEQDVAAAREMLGEATFAAAFAAGRALPLVVAAEEALAAALPPAPAVRAEPPPGPLTAREREVAGLIAEGRTNRQIAEALSISRNTVERHVENILNKLGLASRAQVAAWAVAHGLTPPPGA